MSVINRLAVYTIRPKNDLAATAVALGEALGHTQFTIESTGRYEEFPAYVAEAFGLSMALLGNPSPEYEIRDHASDNFELQITVVSQNSQNNTQEKVNSLILNAIRSKTGLECWLEGWS